MNKGQVNLQDTFLNEVRKQNVGVTIYLIGGVQLRGQVRGFDTFTILLDSQGRPTQLVYKSAITSIVPMRPVNMREAQMAAREAAGQNQTGQPSDAGGEASGVEGVESLVDGASAVPPGLPA